MPLCRLEDDLNLIAISILENGRQSQFVNKWKTTPMEAPTLPELGTAQPQLVFGIGPSGLRAPALQTLGGHYF